jgi:hypothetical protein
MSIPVGAQSGIYPALSSGVPAKAGMISIMFNIVGVGIFVAALVIAGLLGGWMWKFDKGWFLYCGTAGCFMAGGVFMVLFDFWYRMTHGECSLLQPRRGGYFFLIPVWMLGGVCIVAGLCATPRRNIEVSARQSYASKASPSQKSSYPSASANSPKRSQMPSSPSLILGMISGVGSNRIATVNGQPFAQGECHTVTIGSTKRLVQCTHIRGQSVVVTLDGDSKPRELKIGEPLVYRR